MSRPVRLLAFLHSFFSQMTTCNICGRALDVSSDPLSIDCGGDCWGCVGEIEANMGDESSLQKVRKEFALGLRPDWVETEGPSDR